MQDTLSVVINAVLVTGVIGPVAVLVRRSPLRIVLRYFTVLSNLLCAAAALLMAVCRLCGTVPQAVYVLKYTGTCAVTVTMLTVLFFLGPVIGYRVLLTGPDFWLHLFCPVLAVASLLTVDRPASAGIWWILPGTVPLIAYAFLYLYKVLAAPADRRWEDFYGFNRGGHWPVSLIVMLAGALLISLVLWRLMVG